MAIALSVAFTATPTAALTKLVIEASPQLSAGINFIKPSMYRQIFVGAAASSSPSNILAAYNAKFGALVSGKKIFFRLWVVGSTGLRSQPLEVAQIVT
jgi:hypothetical protein